MSNGVKINQTTKETSWLSKDLKRLILISLILIIILIGLSIIDMRTNFLANLAESMMEKLIGQ